MNDRNIARPVFRPVLGSITLCCLTTLYLLLVTNWTFWGKAHTYLAGDGFAFVAFVIGITALFMAVATLFSAKYLTKPVLIFFILTSSAASWFNDQFGVVIDKEMIRNAAVSTGAEAGHLITLRFAVHLLLTAVLPSLLIVWIRIRHRRILPKLAHNTAMVMACLAIFMVAGLGYYKTFAGVGRAHRDILATLNPFMPINNAVSFAVSSERDSHIVAEPLGTDAHRINIDPSGKPRVTIVVAGETARASDFALGGYSRDTNPEMKARNVVYFPNTSSCGTATATSIPCMYSVYPRVEYTHRKGLQTENLLDVLSHAKVDVSWLDNDTGSYNVTDRVPYQYLPNSKDPRFCKDGECLDEILVDKVDDWLDHVKGDSVLVLHQLGSHGPAYFQRYPDAFRRFTPDCRANDFGSCSPEEITNAYDNTILYTDHVIAAVIDKLKQRTTVNSAVVYISDHGESLGENGIYLHGTPYFIAPTQQTHVPFLAWISDDLSKSAGFDSACLGRQAGAQYSQDNFFHSILGLMDVSTKVYDAKLDVFAQCRRPAAAVASAN